MNVSVIISMENLLFQKMLPHLLVKRAQPVFGTFNDPVSHILAGNLNTDALEGFFLTVKRQAFDIFLAHDVSDSCS